MRMNKVLLIIIILVIILIFVVLNQGQKKEQNKEQNTNIETKSNNNTVLVDNSTTLGIKNVCEGCHLSGKSSIPQALKVQPHTKGGLYCLICHKFSHDKHPLNQNVTCQKCHGDKNFSVPVSSEKIVCINCHNYPDPLQPSYGNLITIHRQRDISCINCHADNCTKCHSQIGTSDRWTKRLIHFNTILGSLPFETNIST